MVAYWTKDMWWLTGDVICMDMWCITGEWVGMCGGSLDMRWLTGHAWAHRTHGGSLEMYGGSQGMKDKPGVRVIMYVYTVYCVKKSVKAENIPKK